MKRGLPKRIRKRILRSLVGRFFVTLLVRRNQQSIIRAANFNKRISLSPWNKNGSWEHYYHFIFDLLLPLSCVMDRTSEDVTFSIDGQGPLFKVLPQIFGKRVELNKRVGTSSVKKMNIVSMNPILANLKNEKLDCLKENVFKCYKVKTTAVPNKVLLIERLPSDSFFNEKAKRKGSGANRRSIKNHNEFCNMLRSKLDSRFEFHNLKLEEISFEDQVKYFESAALIIGQHGAGLANVIWMQEGSNVIELGNGRKHFQHLCTIKKHNQFIINYRKKHIKVPLDKFYQWMVSHEQLAKFFAA